MIKKYFVTGLVILLPLAVTIAIIIFVVNFLTKPFMESVSHLLLHYGFSSQFILYSSKVLILVALFGFTVMLGMVTRWFFIKSLFRLGDKILHRIPLVNTVYKTSQDIIKTLFVSDRSSFKQVVMVEFPRAGIYALGLVARESPPSCSSKAGVNLISVLIPTTPNPTTGFLLMMKAEELHFIDMKPEDAIKYIVSCGVIIPEEKTSILT